MTSQFFTYNRGKVIQALRYHFITRKEIKALMIGVNIYAIISAGLYFFHIISPFAFLLSSALWFIMMILFWFLLPIMIYKRTNTFQAKLKVLLTDDEFIIQTANGGGNNFKWSEFNSTMESPHFFHLYFDSRSFFIVPKDAFTEEELPAVRKILATKIPK